MKKKIVQYLILAFAVLISFETNAQLANGSTAPDFVLTDRDGNSHDLYSYLDEGKVVFLKFFACHCPGCWAYHNTGKLESLYQLYGPEGTDQIRVIMLEYDINNPEAFAGGGSYTQGNWETGNTIPMVDVEGADRWIFTSYNMTYYPMIYKICNDKKTELMSTTLTIQQLFDEADECPGNLTIENNESVFKINFDQISKQLSLIGFSDVSNVVLMNVSGQIVLSLNYLDSDIIDLSNLNKGVYIVQIKHSAGIYKKKIALF